MTKEEMEQQLALMQNDLACAKQEASAVDRALSECQTAINNLSASLIHAKDKNKELRGKRTVIHTYHSTTLFGRR